MELKTDAEARLHARAFIRLHPDLQKNAFIESYEQKYQKMAEQEYNLYIAGLILKDIGVPWYHTILTAERYRNIMGMPVEVMAAFILDEWKRRNVQKLFLGRSTP